MGCYLYLNYSMRPSCRFKTNLSINADLINDFFWYYFFWSLGGELIKREKVVGDF